MLPVVELGDDNSFSGKDIRAEPTFGGGETVPFVNYKKGRSFMMNEGELDTGETSVTKLDTIMRVLSSLLELFGLVFKGHASVHGLHAKDLISTLLVIEH